MQLQAARELYESASEAEVTLTPTSVIKKEPVEDFYRYVLIPEGAPLTAGSKYGEVRDNGGRNYTTFYGKYLKDGQTRYRFARVHNKYWKYTTRKWGLNDKTAWTLNMIPGDSGLPAVKQDRIVICPEDHGSGFISMNNFYTPDPGLETIVKSFNVKAIIGPMMDNSFDYSKLEKREGLIYIIPTPVPSGSKTGPEDVVTDGVRVFKKYKTEWLKHILPPAVPLAYLDDAKEITVVVNRPDILVCPTSSSSSDRQMLGITMSYSILKYLSILAGQDMLKEYTRGTVDRLWSEKLAKALSGANSNDAERRLNDATNNYRRKLEELGQLARSIENIKIQRQKSTELKSDAGLEEMKVLRDWGCWIEDDLIVYPFYNLKIEDQNKHWHFIGDIEVVYDVANNRVMGRRRPGAVAYNKNSSNPHPHVNTGGSICLGTVAEDVAMAMKTMNISRVFADLMMIVPVYNEKSPWCDIQNWPLCEKDGTLLLDAKGAWTYRHSR